MSEISRRDALRRLALVLTATGVIDRVGAEEVHAFAAEAQASNGGTYAPKTFTDQQFRTLERLTDHIIPAHPAQLLPARPPGSIRSRARTIG